MSLTEIDIDDDTLAEAMELMGTESKADTVNRALAEYIKAGEGWEVSQREDDA